MTPAKQAKQLGLKSLVQVSELSGFPVSTLNDMARNYPNRFTNVLFGCWSQLNNVAVLDKDRKIAECEDEIIRLNHLLAVTCKIK